MIDATANPSDPPAPTVAPPTSPATAPDAKTSPRHADSQGRVAEISSLLSSLEDAATESGLTTRPAPAPSSGSLEQETRLVEGRLGVANSLFTALKYKHPQTAAHSLRVAMWCSSWATVASLDDTTRDTVELAALMHDIGKIGVADAILLKPTRLNAEETGAVSRRRQVGLDILTSCCGDQRVLDAVQYAGTRYDGQHGSGSVQGEAIPLEARMISIVDAFDAMTTDHVYRPAKSRERALNELFEYAGTQFDPDLVKQFVEILSKNQDAYTGQIASRWLTSLAGKESNLPWTRPHESAPATTTPEPATAVTSEPRSLFEQKLIDTMHDGVVFVDDQGRILLWSKGAERLTGVGAGAAAGRAFAPSLLDMCNHANRRIADEACPVAKALITNTQLRQRLLVMGRRGKHVAVDLHVIPVHSSDGTVQGATVLLHDAQPEASLEEKCEALHAEVTKDPMTKVANRAEFDRMLALFIEAHQQAGLPCSLVMCDIDHFKSINDTHGHQAGDEAIMAMANLLSSMCRSGDLVARYGGEEFAVLCADCSNADGARRAEEIRRKLAELQHASLGNKRITASFGVTELQSGDTPETMLRRSDRALLMAKDQGRNQVVQLGNGMEKEKPKRKWWKINSLRAQPVVQAKLVSAVPIDIAVEKLRGFVSDHQAKIVSTKENAVELEISSESITYGRRKGDRHVTFRVELKFCEARIERTNNQGFAAGEYVHTNIELRIRPKRAQKRRRADVADRARLLLQSIKAYLMAKDGAEARAEMATLG